VHEHRLRAVDAGTLCSDCVEYDVRRRQERSAIEADSGRPAAAERL
jgi:hypothetical protein